MDTLYIQGGHPLEGELPVHGAKNSALPLLAATLLPHGVSTLHRCPHLSDVEASMAILRHLGCRAVREGQAVTVDATDLTDCAIPDTLMRQMRSSIVFLGAIIARCGQATLTYPGGCELGPRPIDLHLDALRRLGVTIEEEGGHILCHADKGLRGAEITLSFPSVGATENVLLAACTAAGTTVLHNAAREPEIEDLCGYLVACGARIAADGQGTLVIEGVPRLEGWDHTVMPDRIEAITWLAIGAATGSHLLVQGCASRHVAAALPPLEQAGCMIRKAADTLELTAPRRLRSMGLVRTMPYPGFPTDGAAPLLAAATVAEGSAVFVETIFENRYLYADELSRMGARVRVDGRVAVVEGVPSLSGASVACTDLRGGAALVVAALAAQGTTTVTQLAHLDRGYDNMTACLQAVGAHVERRSQ